MKKLFVFVKDVPNTNKIRIDYAKGTLKRETAKAILNPPDETAVYWALKLKKEQDFHITAFCMGPVQSAEKLELLLSLGFNQAFLITGAAFAGSDTLATATVLSQAALKLGGADLYLFGSHSLDGDTGQVPGEFCEIINIPSLTSVTDLNLLQNGIQIFQDLDEKREIQCNLPVGLSFQENKNLKMPMVKANLFFQKKEWKILSEKELGLTPNQSGSKGSPTKVIKVCTPEFKRKPIIKVYSPDWIRHIIQKEIIISKFLTL